MATINTDDLPEWAQEAVLKGQLTGNFSDLARLLEPKTGHGPRGLTDEQRHGLYQLAKPVFMQEARKYYAHFRAGRAEYALRLLELANGLRARGKLDLKTELEMSTADWDALAYLSRVHEVSRHYHQALNGSNHAKRALAEHVLDSSPLEPWEYGAQQSEVTKLAREAFSPKINELVSECRQGDYGSAAWLQKILTRLEYSCGEMHGLGVTFEEVNAWTRQSYIVGVRFQLGTSLDGDELTLFLNSYGSLQRMLEHSIAPEEADIIREDLRRTRDRMATWLPRAIRRPNDEVGPMASREQLKAYQALVLPLFDRVLAL